MRTLLRMSLVAVTVLALVLPAAAQEAEKASKAEKLRSVYRVDFVVRESEEGKPINSRHYSQLVEENGWCRVRAGARVPIQGEKGTQYMDVGVNIDCQLGEQDGQVRMEVRLELTSFAKDPSLQSPPLLRVIRAEVQTGLAPGKPTVVSSVDDAASPRRYQLEVTATKVK